MPSKLFFKKKSVSGLKVTVAMLVSLYVLKLSLTAEVSKLGYINHYEHFELPQGGYRTVDEKDLFSQTQTCSSRCEDFYQNHLENEKQM